MFAQIKSLFKSPAPAAPTKDQAWSESSIYGGADFPKYNPDDLLSRRGLGVYQRMMTDEQIKAVVRFKRDAITSRAWILECEHDELSDEERELRSEVFEYAIERMQGTFTDALNGIMSALYNGYSMTEKLYQPIEYAGKAWIGVKALKLRPCDTFFFHVDECGNVMSVKQQMNAKEQDIDVKRFIHYVQNPDYDEHYGRSELRECYRAWFSKDMIIKFQNIHLERFAAGFVWAQPKEGKTIAPGSQEETNLRSVMSNIQAKTSIILPSMMDLHIEHPSTTDAFERAVAQQDKAIAKALLVPNLLGISEQGQHGSLAQADTQLEAFLWTLEADASRLADALNEQLFRELGDLNFGDNLYPKFKFKPVSNKRQDELIRTWQTLVTAGAVTATDKDEEHLREIMEFPEKGTPLNQPAPGATPAPEGQMLPEEQPEQEAPAEPATQLDETVIGKTRVTVSAFSRAMKRVDFAVIANKVDNSAEDASQEIAMLNSQAVARLVSLAEELKLGTAEGNPNDIQKIQYTASEMAGIKNAVASGLKAAWNIGESHARRELQKARHQAFAFEPDQPRDEDGKWTDGGGGSAGVVGDGGHISEQQSMSLPLSISGGDFQELNNPEFVAKMKEWKHVPEIRGEATLREILQDDKFVTIKEQVLYAGVNQAQIKDGVLESKGARYMTPDKDRAARYGEVIEITVPSGSRIAWATQAGLIEAIALPGSKIIKQGAGWKMQEDGSTSTRNALKSLDEIRQAVKKGFKQFAFDPDQPRNDHGKWTDGGGASGTPKDPDNPETWDRAQLPKHGTSDMYHVTDNVENIAGIYHAGLISGHISGQSSLPEPVPTNRVFITTSRAQADVLFAQFKDNGQEPAILHLRLPNSIISAMDPRIDPGVEKSWAMKPTKKLTSDGMYRIYASDGAKVPTAWRNRVEAPKQFAVNDLALQDTAAAYLKQKARFSSVEFGFDPDQPRDESGKWADGGGAGGATTTARLRSDGSVVGADGRVLKPTKSYAGIVYTPTKFSGDTEFAHLRDDALTHAGNVAAVRGTIEQVAFKDIISTQGGVSADRVISLAKVSDVTAVGKKQPIIGIRVNGAVLLLDGNHRMAAAYLQGAKTIPIKLITAGSLKLDTYENIIRSNRKLLNMAAKVVEVFTTNDLALQDTAAAYLKQKAYTLAGDISNATQKTIRNILMEGVKTSKQPSDTRTAIYKALESDGLVSEEAVQEALGTTTVKSTKARINTAIRTASFEAINEARYQFFSEPALDGFVEALEYSAILDDRTTEICSQLNGQTYAIDDEVWSTFRPPNHFNCRSILIPVTVRDTWQQSDQPNVLPQKGFGFNRCCNHGGVK